MHQIPRILKGNIHSDHRGTVSFINDFDMSPVKRFYVIEHPTTKTIRAWRGHKIEQRWFRVTEGEFLIRLIKIDNWESPEKILPAIEFILSVSNMEVLHVPSGYASWIQAVKNNSKLLVFADYSIDNAENDNYLYPENYFEE